MAKMPFALILAVIVSMGTLFGVSLRDQNKRVAAMDKKITETFNAQGYKTESVADTLEIVSDRGKDKDIFKSYTFNRNDSLYTVKAVLHGDDGKVVSKTFTGMKR